MVSFFQRVSYLIFLASLSVFAQGNSGNGNGDGNGNGNGNGNGSPPTSPPAAPATVDIEPRCVLVPDAYSNNLEQFTASPDLLNPFTQDYISKNFNPFIYTDGSGAAQDTRVLVTTRFADRVFLRAYCYVGNPTEVTGNPTLVLNDIDFELASDISKPCSASLLSGKACVEAKSRQNTVSLSKNSGPQLAATLVLKNLSANGTSHILKASDVKFKATGAGAIPLVSDITTGDVEIQSLSGNASCRIVVSGSTQAGGTKSLNCGSSGACNPSQVNSVQNGDLIFRAVLDGVPGWQSIPSKIDWSGGPENDGIWKNPPVGSESVVSAQVTLSNGESARCAVRIKPDGVPFKVTLKRAGDCSMFSSLKYYYLYNANNKQPQESPLAKPIKYMGSEAEFGKKGGEVPFGGVMNGAAAFNGKVVMGAGGRVSMPPVNRRAFSKAVIVATPYKPNDPKEEFGKPAFYGFLDYSDYRQTTLTSTGLYDVGQLGDDDFLVFQVFLAAVQRDDKNPNVDRRGQDLPYFMFKDSVGKLPFDRLVPLMYDSCIPLFNMQVPGRADKKMPSELTNASMCAYSRPQRYGDFKSGRVNLNVMHMVPESAHSQFPIEMMKASMQPQGCVATNPSDTVECWNVSSPIPESAQLNPFDSNTACEYEETIMVPQNVSVTNRYGQVTGSYTVMVPQIIKKYKTGCTVMEKDKDNECSNNLAMRFSGYSMMQGAALGCAVKYDGRTSKAGNVLDLNGSTIAPTLNNQGIIPYTAFGGSIPKKFGDYSGTKDGFGCIPCRFGVQENLQSSTAPLPVDQDQENNPRKPIFSFAKSQAPRECAKEIKWEVRYFGSGACDGVNNPAGHFCKSDNISQQSCPASTETITDRGAFSGGGNVAGAFKVKVCNGSSFEYDSVSVSWSPLIIDVAGRGVEISRDFSTAVSFDIKGKGETTLVDWPMNTEQAAFLVRPGKDGKVRSIKQLFGDNDKKNGFEALKKYDSNRDGIVDSKDKKFKELALWFDRNRNGEVDAKEIVSIAESNVGGIYLNYTKPSDKGIEGKTLLSVYFDKKDLKFKNVVDVYFYEYWKGGRRLASSKAQ